MLKKTIRMWKRKSSARKLREIAEQSSDRNNSDFSVFPLSILCSSVGIAIIAWLTVQYTKRLTWLASGTHNSGYSTKIINSVVLMLLHLAWVLGVGLVRGIDGAMWVSPSRTGIGWGVDICARSERLRLRGDSREWGRWCRANTLPQWESAGKWKLSFVFFIIRHRRAVGKLTCRNNFDFVCMINVSS